MLKYFLFVLTFSLFLINNSLAEEEVIDNVRAIGKFSGIEIKWNGKNTSEFGGFVLIRTESVPPKDVDDGEEVYRGNGGEFFDESVEKDKEYYYGLAATDNFGNVIPLGISEKVSRIDFWSSLGKVISENYILVVGPLIIITLAFLDYFTRVKVEREAERGSIYDF
jgi:hypothetical protein